MICIAIDVQETVVRAVLLGTVSAWQFEMNCDDNLCLNTSSGRKICATMGCDTMGSGATTEGNHVVLFDGKILHCDEADDLLSVAQNIIEFDVSDTGLSSEDVPIFLSNDESYSMERQRIEVKLSATTLSDLGDIKAHLRNLEEFESSSPANIDACERTSVRKKALVEQMPIPTSCWLPFNVDDEAGVMEVLEIKDGIALCNAYAGSLGGLKLSSTIDRVVDSISVQIGVITALQTPPGADSIVSR